MNWDINGLPEQPSVQNGLSVECLRGGVARVKLLRRDEKGSHAQYAGAKKL
jgi:hypothetical protein